MFYRMNIGTMVNIDDFLEMLSSDRNKALEKYIELIDEEISDYEALEDKYERNPIIGSEQFIRTITEIKEDERITLDEILKVSCPTENEFNLIKQGSRKRYLTKYKVKYIQLGKKEGYTYEEIGENIGVSGTSIRKMLME